MWVWMLCLTQTYRTMLLRHIEAMDKSERAMLTRLRAVLTCFECFDVDQG